MSLANYPQVIKSRRGSSRSFPAVSYFWRDLAISLSLSLSIYLSIYLSVSLCFNVTIGGGSISPSRGSTYNSRYQAKYFLIPIWDFFCRHAGLIKIFARGLRVFNAGTVYVPATRAWNFHQRHWNRKKIGKLYNTMDCTYERFYLFREKLLKSLKIFRL